ncbi:disease resistance protein RPP13 [Ziziphus jujuba]|uniref:Disease resistance protein RPP13 n=1 Tax=Ziziphus jujuba TaxID=326968 RepID=A0A6P4B2P2_ZIZJJ|nr:disease resistance protein RPP13 [Ziziphus jujuba]
MADSVASFVLEKFAEVLKQEISLLSGVKEQVKSLENELVMINGFLRNSEGDQQQQQQQQHDHNDAVKEAFIEQIRDVARDAEDVIDKYIVHVIKQKRRTIPGKLLHSLDVHDVANTITDIKNIISNCFANREKYANQGSRQPSRIDVDAAAAVAAADGGSRPSFRRSRTAVERDHVVGLEDHIYKLVNQLTQDRCSRRDVISITGMGGSGKTKLAKKIYQHNAVIAYFQTRVWVDGSREYKSRDWLLGILSCLTIGITNEILGMPDDKLKQTLRKGLQGKRYLVVMDGMWNNGVWNTINTAFPDEPKGGRILITCREKVVTSIDDCTTLPYSLPPLNEKQSLELLCKNVFPNGDCPRNLKTYVKQHAESCKGLPLSIVVLGDNLKRKDIFSYRTWSDTIDADSNHRKQCLDILGQSYKHLPRHLKCCFLYLGLFPKQFEIPARQLIELWSAEGFIKANGGRDVVKVAEDCLEELIDRSLIEVVSKRTDGGVKTCRIHYLLQELCKSESEREKFLEVHRISDSEVPPPWSKARRLSIQGSTSHYISSFSYNASSARSLLLFSENNLFETNHWQKICKSFMYVRLLYLWKVQIESIPKDIENLVLLRYIRIWNDQVLKIPAIPDSICSLRYLESIDINGQVIEYLPKKIWRMKQLRHLKVSKSMRLRDPPRRNSGTSVALVNLRILSGLAVDKKTKLLMAKARSKFPNVEKLHLVSDTKKPMVESEVADLLESLKNLQRLKSLKVVNFPKFQPRISLLPSTLNKITIVSSCLDLEHFKILGQLSNLRILKLRKTYRSSPNMPSKLSCLRGEFSTLEVFQMMGLTIETWEMKRGAMPNLQRLVIKDCYELRNLPNELSNSIKLRHVEVSEMSENFMKLLVEFKVPKECELLTDSNVQEMDDNENDFYDASGDDLNYYDPSPSRQAGGEKMADIIVPVFMENLTKPVGHEANLLLEVKDHVCLLEDDLGIINTFLKDFDGKQNEHNVMFFGWAMITPSLKKPTGDISVEFGIPADKPRMRK